MDNEKNIYKMNKIMHPKWIIFTISVPQLILFFIVLQSYLIIKSQLNEFQNSLWLIFGFILVGLNIGYSIYAIVLWLMKKNVHRIFPVIILISYIAYLYLFFFYSNNFISGFPLWMLNVPEIILYIGTFVIPCFFYSLLLGENILRSIFKKQRILINFLFVLAIPVCWYLVYNLIMKQHEYVISKYQILLHLIIIFIIVFTICFYFFLVKVLILLYNKKSFLDKILKNRYIWTVIFCLIFPIFGLLLNECYFPFSYLDIENFHSIFGNLSNPIFLILAVSNGIILSVPNLNIKPLRIILFLLRSILFVFTLYFFIVFLPFYPFFIFAIIIFGAGFLIITPLLLLIIHFNILKEDIAYLSGFISKKRVVFILIIFAFIIPCIISILFITEKNNLHKALQYTYYPDYTKNNHITINTSMLEKTLKNIEGINDTRIWSGDTIKIPYITLIYKKIVLNNLTLSSDKIGKLRRIFLSSMDNIQSNYINNISLDIVIKNLNYKTEYDSNLRLYNTWIDIDLKNNKNWQSEFVGYINIPDGVWIDDYYLYVSDVKKHGLLVDKKSALWIYQEIRNEQRDPGLVYYIDRNKIGFRVFPFSKNEIRKTGFKLVHFEPLTISNDKKIINLKSQSNINLPVYSSNKKTVFLSENTKKNLKKIKRTPNYHFIIDCSDKSIYEIYAKKYNYDSKKMLWKINNPEYLKEKNLKLIRDFLNKNHIQTDKVKISFSDYSLKTFQYDKSIDKKIMNHKNRGGFFLDRAIKKILFDHYKEKSMMFPVIIIVSNNLNNAVLENNDFDSNFLYPDSDYLYHLDENCILYKYNINDFFNNNLSKREKTETIDQNQVCLFENNIFVNDDGKPSIVLNGINNIKDLNFEKSINQNNLLSLQGLYLWNIIHPEETEISYKLSYENSIKKNVMSPNTSFIVLENESQEKMLLKKQNEVLNSKKFLDAGEKMTEEMPEPSIMIVGILIILFFIIKKNIKKKDMNNNLV